MIRTGIPIFDSVVGGAVGQRNHLLYGELGVGKSTFALQFLAYGLNHDEPAVLVTRRAGRDVLLHAEALNIPLQPYLRSKQLLMLEYSPDVVERVARAREFSQVLEEFDYFIRRLGVRRIVFDPLTPLVQGMNSSEMSFRARSLMQRMEEHLATSLFLLDLPEANDTVECCKDLVPALLHFQAASGPRSHSTLTLERFPVAVNGNRQIRYSIAAGRGIVEAPPEGVAVEEVSKKKVLLVCADLSVVATVRQLLAEEYEVGECQDIIQAMAQIAAQNHDLLIVDTDAKDNHTVRGCLELRNNQFNLPILLLVRGQQKRLRDRLAFLAQGIDDCLEKPLDGRLLRVRVRSLLKRYSLRDRFCSQETDRVVLAGLKRFVRDVGIVDDVDVFRAFLEEEVGHAEQFAVPFTVCLFDYASSASRDVDLAAGAILRLIRPQDKVYREGNAVAVLLAETNDSGTQAFLRRVQILGNAATPAQTRIFAYDGSPEFVSQLLTLICPAWTGPGALDGERQMEAPGH